MSGDPPQAWRALSRRRFLGGVGAAAAAGILPSGCGGVREAWRSAPQRPPGPLGERALAVLRAAAERVVGGRGGARIRAREVDPAAAVEAFLARSPDLVGPLEAALLLLEFAPWPLLPKLGPFTGLDGSGRDRVLRGLAGSRLERKRELFQGVRSMALLGYYGSPAWQPLSRHPALAGVGVADALAPADGAAGRAAWAHPAEP